MFVGISALEIPIICLFIGKRTLLKKIIGRFEENGKAGDY